VVEEIQGSSWSLRNLNAIQKELKQFMVLRYQETLNDKTWQSYLTRKLKHGSQFYLKGRWIFIWWKHSHVYVRWINRPWATSSLDGLNSPQATSIFCSLARSSSVLSYSLWQLTQYLESLYIDRNVSVDLQWGQFVNLGFWSNLKIIVNSIMVFIFMIYW